MNAIRIHVPDDTMALAMGADAVTDALLAHCQARGDEIKLVRNSSRGLFWLEPFVEVDTPAGRMGYGPVTAADIPDLLAADFLHGGGHALLMGRVLDIPYLARQQRLTFARFGVTEPLSLADYEAHGGWAGLRRALELGPDAIVAEIHASGLRGRGGAAFPAGIKWRTVAATDGAQKYIVCNADEGDSGSFADRMILEGDPYQLVEGMVIAALAVGASRGFVYIRSEYPRGFQMFGEAIRRARAAGVIGPDAFGSGRGFEIEARLGAGSYVCGEETALLESLEGKRGVVRAKPPLPAHAGLFGKPTLIHNVLTLAAAATILSRGAAHYRNIGGGRSAGTMPFQLAGNIKHGGLVELGFGATLRELLYDYGGGTASGRPIKAVQVGGPLGAYLPESQWDLPLDYEAFAEAGATLGHGSIVVHDDTADLAQLARYAMEFCAAESCGKCTPCRIGSIRGVEIMDRILDGPASIRSREIAVLHELCNTMEHGSLCAMGGMTPYPVRSALKHFPADFGTTAGAVDEYPAETSRD